MLCEAAACAAGDTDSECAITGCRFRLCAKQEPCLWKDAVLGRLRKQKCSFFAFAAARLHQLVSDRAACDGVWRRQRHRCGCLPSQNRDKCELCNPLAMARLCDVLLQVCLICTTGPFAGSTWTSSTSDCTSAFQT